VRSGQHEKLDFGISTETGVASLSGVDVAITSPNVRISAGTGRESRIEAEKIIEGMQRETHRNNSPD
jgi:hypothetical protein